MLPPDDCEPSQSSVVAPRDQVEDHDVTNDSALRVSTSPSAVKSTTRNDLFVMLAALTVALLCLAALLTALCYWRRRRCVSVLSKRISLLSTIMPLKDFCVSGCNLRKMYGRRTEFFMTCSAILHNDS